MQRHRLLLLLLLLLLLSSNSYFTALDGGNIHLSWDVVINRIRLGGLICSLKSPLQLLLLLLLSVMSRAILF